jgi:glutamate dehydrogenase/leucine dehydrogenase
LRKTDAAALVRDVFAERRNIVMRDMTKNKREQIETHALVKVNCLIAMLAAIQNEVVKPVKVSSPARR